MARLFSLFNMYVLGVLVRHLEPYGPWLILASWKEKTQSMYYYLCF